MRDTSAARRARGCIEWAEYEHRLGTCSDPELARQLSIELGKHVGTTAVQSARDRRGIASYRVPTDYMTGDAFVLMGTMTDAELAKRIGRSASAVSGARRRRGEHAYMGEMPQRANKGVDWDAQDPNEDESTQAKRLGVKVASVRQARERRRVKLMNWLDQMRLRIAEQSGVDVDAVTLKSWDGNELIAEIAVKEKAEKIDIVLKVKAIRDANQSEAAFKDRAEETVKTAFGRWMEKCNG